MGRNVIVVCPGIVINGVKVIRELEKRVYKDCTKRVVEYECPTCKQPSVNTLQALVRGAIKQCRTCAVPPVEFDFETVYGNRRIVKELPSYVEPCGTRRRMVQCECDRGHITEVSLIQLLRLKQQCGECITEDAKIKNCAEYQIWLGMRERCFGKTNEKYPDYGGRGITIDSRWDDFFVFLKDMGHRPTPHHTIERIDNDKSYSPENCKWATQREQNRNKRSNRWIEYKKEKMIMSDWAAKAGVPRWKVFYLLEKYNDDANKAFAELGL